LDLFEVLLRSVKLRVLCIRGCGLRCALRGVDVWGVADQRFSPALLKPNRAPLFADSGAALKLLLLRRPMGRL